MTNVAIYADADALQPIATWFERTCGLPLSLVRYVICDAEDKKAIAWASSKGLAHITPQMISRRLHPSDAVVVTGPCMGDRVDSLLALGLVNIFDGERIVRSTTPASSLHEHGARFFLGRHPPTQHDPGAREASRFRLEPLEAGAIPRHKLFIVNSLPKSGTVWMIGMLERILRITAEEQIVLSHVADLEGDWDKWNNQGAVTLVRDIRDVVVSWFHDMEKADRRAGYKRPRYPTIEDFYYRYFIGAIFGSPRYYHGRLEHWLNISAANFIPLISYERMHADAAGVLEDVLNAWQVSCEPGVVEEVVRSFAFRSIGDGAKTEFIDRFMRAGHMRAGAPGGWRTELPSEIVADVDVRFAGFQSRLGYASAG